MQRGLSERWKLDGCEEHYIYKVLHVKNSQTGVIIWIHSFHELASANLLNPRIDRNFDYNFCSFQYIYSKTTSSTIF